VNRSALIIASVALLAAPSASRAAAQVVVAPPGSQLTGVYLAPVTLAVQAQPVTFVNLDVAATAPHNIKAVDYGPNNAPWCGSYPSGKCPLFVSDLVPAGGTSTADLRNTATGETYQFVCTLHPSMTGSLMVVA